MKKLFLILCVLIFSITIWDVAYASGIPIDISDEQIEELKTIQEVAHNFANNARYLGCEETDLVIDFARAKWWEAEYQLQEIEYWKKQKDIEIIAVVIYNEALGGCTDRHRELVAAVILNRVSDSRFPNTVFDVVAQPGQYCAGYVDPESCYYQSAINDFENFKMCFEIATKAMNGEVKCPANVLYQSNYASLGSGYYELCYTDYSVTYFSYG